MAAAVNVVYYCDNLAAHRLICSELCSSLTGRGHSVTLVCQSQEADSTLRQLPHAVACRCRAQSTDPREALALINEEAAWLRSKKADVVISAAVPFGCSAAAAAGVCAVCIAHCIGGDTNCRSYALSILPYPWFFKTTRLPALNLSPLVPFSTQQQTLQNHSRLALRATSACRPCDAWNATHICMCLLQKQPLYPCMRHNLSKPTPGTVALAMPWRLSCCGCLAMLPCFPSTTLWTSPSLCLKPSSAKKRCLPV